MDDVLGMKIFQAIQNVPEKEENLGLRNGPFWDVFWMKQECIRVEIQKLPFLSVIDD